MENSNYTKALEDALSELDKEISRLYDRVRYYGEIPKPQDIQDLRDLLFALVKDTQKAYFDS